MKTNKEEQLKKMLLEQIDISLKKAHKIINNGIKNKKLAKQVCYGATIGINESINALKVTFELIDNKLKKINNHCDNIDLMLKK